MRRLWIPGMLLVALAAGACDRKPKVDVKAPDADVKVEPEREIDVKAPGVDVNVVPGKGVDVKAPGVDVDVERGEGPRIRVDGDNPQ